VDKGLTFDQACKQVSADYDVVTAFFEDMNAFLQRITILESRLPNYPAYRNCLMDVFTSVLEMCGFATKYIQLKRFKKWILNMLRGEDSELAGARKGMDTKMSRLQSATEYAILGNTEKLQTMSAELKENEEMQTRMLEEQSKMLTTVIESQENVRNDLKDIRKLLSVFQEQRKEESHGGKQKGAMGKPPTSNRVRSFFWDLIDPAHEHHNLKESLIPEMSTWVFEEEEWDAWVAQDKEKETSKLLYIAGAPGTGKSHIAVNAHDRLVQLAEKDPDRNTCVVHFYFRETRNETRCFCNAINWLVIQMAERSSYLCEKINAEMSREDDDIEIDDWKDIWKKVIAPLFESSSSSRLQIVFDGLDELAPDGVQRPAGLEFLKTVAESDLNISVLCTTRSTSSTSTFPTQLDDIGSKSIMVTKEKQLPDYKTLIWHHLNNDTELKKLSQYMRQRVSSTLEEKADCLLYAEHILRRFNNLSREPLILRHLEQEMPENLEQLYSIMSSDLLRKTSNEQRQALKGLFFWIAFAVRPITLSEALVIVKLLPGDLDLEDELQSPQLGRFLRVADRVEEVNISSPSSDSELDDLQGQERRHESAHDDWNLPLKFRERSMRDYFRGAKFDEDPDSLRTTGFEAHRQIFVTLSQILCKKAGTDTSDRLRAFAGSWWFTHLGWVWWYNKLGRPTEEQKIELLDAIGAVFNGEGEAAASIEKQGTYYWNLGTNGLETKFKYFAEVASEVGEGKLKESTSAWTKEISSNWQKAFMNLAKSHIRRLFSATDLKAAQQSYKLARSALWMVSIKTSSFALAQPLTSDQTDLSHLVKKLEYDDDTGEEIQESEEILAITKAFPDIVDNNASYAIALLLYDAEYYIDALPEAQNALEVASSDPVKKFQASDLLANIQLWLENYEEASSTITSSLEDTTDISPALVRRSLVTRAKIESAQSQIDNAVASYEAARRTLPDTPMLGEDLQTQFGTLLSNKFDDPAAIVSTVKSWTPLERLAWATWKYAIDGEQHLSFQRACGRANERDFMIASYKEIVNFLDAVDAGAPMRLELAYAQWRVCGDLAAAKELVDEILETESDGSDYRFTGEDPSWILVRAIDFISDVLYEQFRTSADPQRKAAIVAEMKGVTSRPLARSVSSWKSMVNHHRLVLARMVKKTGPAVEYQELLQQAFDVCYESLNDAVGWNDSEALCAMAMVLDVVGGLEKEAKTLISAVFSVMDKSLDAEGEGDAEDGDKTQADDKNGDGADKGADGDADKGAEKDADESADEEDDGEEDSGEENNGEEDDGEDKDTASTTTTLPTDEGDLDGDTYFTCDGSCNPNTSIRAWKGRTL
jgi:tetratricopeptide (TPR) repeat protein